MPLNDLERSIAETCIRERPRLAQAIRELRDKGAEKSHVNIVLKRKTRGYPGVQSAVLCMLDYIWMEEDEEHTEEMA